MPGGDVGHMDRQSFGDRPDLPSYEPHPDDIDPERTEAIGGYLGAVMAAGPYPAIDELWLQSVERRAARPRMEALSEDELLDSLRAAAPAVRSVWASYIYVSVASTVGPGAVQAMCQALELPDLSAKLISGIGDVVSAQAPRALWRLSRLVAGSTELTEPFDAGLPGLLERIEADPSADAKQFLAAFNAFLDEFGHRGPNEWDLRSPSWENDPSIVLGILDRLRFQTDDHDPMAAAARAAAERDAVLAEVGERAGSDAAGGLEAAMRAAHVWLARRELAKDASIRSINEGRIAARELGRRAAADGRLAEPDHVFMLLDAELDGLVAGDPSLAATAAARARTFATLADLEPPYFVDVRRGVPPLSGWERRHRAEGVCLQAGEALQGMPGAPGEAVGRARIIDDPLNAGDLQPGDVMVVRSTDPSWTPLFLSVAGVISDRGATISHAAIASRELGIPCVVSCVGATDRIADGSLVSLDGSTGRVTVLVG
jgi:pyruvate,water dikinase